MLKKIGTPMLFFTIILLLWEMGYRFFEHMHFIAPSPLNTVSLIFNHSDRFSFHTFTTLCEMAAGFGIALAIAFPLAWLMYHFQSLRLILQPCFVLIQTIPIFALAPLMIIWFGWTFKAVIILTALMIFFPLTMNIYRGLMATPGHFLEYFKMHQATRWQIFRKLQLPCAAPYIFEGFRISAAISGIGAIAGEWAGAQSGLGLLMIESRSTADLEMMFAALFCLMGLSMTIYGAVLFAEKAICRRAFKPFATVLICTLLILNVSGCQSKNERKTVNVLLDWVPNPNHIPLFVGIEKGFFEAGGIDLNILKVHNCLDSLPLLIGGQTELAVSYMPHVIHNLNHQAPITPIGILIDTPLNSFIFRTKEGITKKEDLKGLKLGYCLESSDTQFLERILQKNGIQFSEMHNVSFNLVAALGTKQVDAIYGAFWNIECENLRALGIQTDALCVMDFGVPRYYELLVLARQNSPQATPQFIEKFSQALQKSIDFCRTNPPEAFAIYLEANRDKMEKTAAWEKEAWTKTLPLLAETQRIDAIVWQNYVDWHNQNP